MWFVGLLMAGQEEKVEVEGERGAARSKSKEEGKVNTRTSLITFADERDIQFNKPHPLSAIVVSTQLPFSQ